MNRLLVNFHDQRVSQNLSQDDQFNIDSFYLIGNYRESNFQRWKVSINEVTSRPRLFKENMPSPYSFFSLLRERSILVAGRATIWQKPGSLNHHLEESCSQIRNTVT